MVSYLFICGIKWLKFKIFYLQIVFYKKMFYTLNKRQQHCVFPSHSYIVLSQNYLNTVTTYYGKLYFSNLWFYVAKTRNINIEIIMNIITLLLHKNKKILKAELMTRINTPIPLNCKWNHLKKKNRLYFMKLISRIKVCTTS